MNDSPRQIHGELYKHQSHSSETTYLGASCSNKLRSDNKKGTEITKREIIHVDILRKINYR